MSTLLLDKTGTITFGNRQAAEFLPLAGVDRRPAARRGPLVQPGRPDPGGPVHRRPWPWRRGPTTTTCPAERPSWSSRPTPGCRESTSPLDRLRAQHGRSARAPAARWSTWLGRVGRRAGRDRRPASPASGGTPAGRGRERTGSGSAVLGVVHLKDVVKPGHAERFDQLRAMGIRTVMITGDNPLTAAGDRRRGRGRRLPGRGDAGGQDAPDPRRAGRAAGWWR